MVFGVNVRVDLLPLNTLKARAKQAATNKASEIKAQWDKDEQIRAQVGADFLEFEV